MKKFVAFVMAIAMVAAMFAVSASAEAGTVKIGVSGPLTGGAAVYGTCVARSAQIAVDEVNALGGLQFELNCQDDEHDAEKAVSAYNSLKDWGMQILHLLRRGLRDPVLRQPDRLRPRVLRRGRHGRHPGCGRL